MNTLDRRQWLKTIGITGTFALLSGPEAWAIESEPIQVASQGLIILSYNENPYGPSKNVRNAMQKAFDNGHRYPFAFVQELLDSIAKKEGVSKEHIVLTGGSTEGLKATGLTFSLNGGEIIAADPTYQSMLHYAEGFGAYVHRVAVNDKLEHDLEAMDRRITSKTRLVFICNPNNPTGTIIEKNLLKDFCHSVSKKTIVFSDEAYYDFITEPDYPSMVELVKENANVVVSKTFSKVYGLAGLRIGYLIARPDIASRIRKNVMAMTNVLAIAAAKEALKDDAFYKFSIAKNLECKKHIYSILDSLQLPYISSHTNFVFFKSGRPIQTLNQQMLQQNVQIGRPFPPMLNWARISTGKVEDVQLFCKALKTIMS